MSVSWQREGSTLGVDRFIDSLQIVFYEETGKQLVGSVAFWASGVIENRFYLVLLKRNIFGSIYIKYTP